MAVVLVLWPALAASRELLQIGMHTHTAMEGSMMEIMEYTEFKEIMRL